MRRGLGMAFAIAAGCQFGNAGAPAGPPELATSGAGGDGAVDGEPTGAATGDTDGDDGQAATSNASAGGDAESGGGMPITSGPLDDGGDTGPVAPGDTTTASSGGVDESESSTGTEAVTYPPCTECAAQQCVSLEGGAEFCSEGCFTADSCPTPTTGTSTVICSPTGVCALQCFGGDCPDGMSCIAVFDGTGRCVW